MDVNRYRLWIYQSKGDKIFLFKKGKTTRFLVESTDLEKMKHLRYAAIDAGKGTAKWGWGF